MTKSVPDKTKKQRSTKSRSLSSSVSKKAKPRKQTAASSKVRKHRKPVIVSKKIINLPLGGGAHLTLAIDRPKKAAQKRRPVAKKTTKRHDKLLTIALLITGVVGTAFFGLRVFASPAPLLVVSPAAANVMPQPVPAQQSMPRSTPTHLRIPEIQLNADIAPVGLLADGTLEVPADYMKAGWYNGSPTPGEIGPAVIDGHLDNVHGVAVFWRLRELIPGQLIAVDRQDGSTAQFVITEVKQFSQGDFPTKEVYGNTNTASLRLITCGGTFNRLTQHYDQNTIVFANLKN